MNVAMSAAGDVERDFWLAYDLLQNPKDHAEFTIVRNWVQKALEVNILELLTASLHLATLPMELSGTGAVCAHFLLRAARGYDSQAQVHGIQIVQGVCTDVTVEREKSILKQGAIQHLYGRLSGKLREGVNDASLLVSHPLYHPVPNESSPFVSNR